ncbi:MAG: sigma-54 dependent transcriptional regulator [Planctomycetota bacterium]
MLRQNPRHHAGSLVNLANYLAQHGRETEVDADLDSALADWPVLKGGVALARMVQCAETCRVLEAFRFLAEIRDEEVLEHYRFLIAQYRLFLDLVLRKGASTTVGAATAILGQALPSGTEIPFWAKVIEFLADRNPAEALRMARFQAGTNPKMFLDEHGFDSFNLIRAELSNGAGPAAKRILEARWEKGNRNYLDALFLARAELLAGNVEASVRHFAAVKKDCERYRAEGRLAFELHLACELSPGQLMELMNAAQKTEKEQIPEVTRRPPDQKRPAQGEPRGAARILGQSAATIRIRDLVAQVSPLDVPVLLTGETGTGKDLVARAIHEAGPRAGTPFIAVNCGSITASLLESELFGHEKGAFTGAEKAHHGLFEAAGSGTLLLDEIGDMPLALQGSLLRVLETNEVRPVGSSSTRKIACRIIAATNADLAGLASKGLFRQDLLFRLRRIEISIPPLRERREDILPLADYFLSERRQDGRRPVMTEALRTSLAARDWPGNVRELRNAIERMRLLSSDKPAYDVADLDLIPPNIPDSREGEKPTVSPKSGPPPATGETGMTAGGELPNDGVEEFLSREKSAMRRLDRLRTLFARHQKFSRIEIIRILGVSPNTAAGYLRQLCREEFIVKVEPTRSPRTHYFALRKTGV